MLTTGYTRVLSFPTPTVCFHHSVILKCCHSSAHSFIRSVRFLCVRHHPEPWGGGSEDHSRQKPSVPVVPRKQCRLRGRPVRTEGVPALPRARGGRVGGVTFPPRREGRTGTSVRIPGRAFQRARQAGRRCGPAGGQHLRNRLRAGEGRTQG